MMNTIPPTFWEIAFSLADQIPEPWREQAAGEAVGKCRRVLHLTQQEVARAAGISQSHLARIEQGMDCQWATLRRIFSAMECDLMLLPKARTPFSKLQERNYGRFLEKLRLKARRRLGLEP